MSHKIVPIIIVAAILMSSHLSGCDSDNPRTPVDSVGNRLLLSAPVQVEINDCCLVMDAYLWRDFMPISPPDGQPLAASVTIRAADSSEIPVNITPLRLWVIKSESEVWETDILAENIRRYDGVVEFPASGGPLWEPGITVQVVVELTKEDGVYFLRSSDVVIHRTD